MRERGTLLFDKCWGVKAAITPEPLFSSPLPGGEACFSFKCAASIFSRRGPRRSHSADRSSPGRPPGGPAPSAPSARPAGCPLRSKRQDPAVAGVPFRAAASPRESDQGVLSSPWLASLSLLSRRSPPHQVPASRGAEAARAAGGPSTPADAAPPPSPRGPRPGSQRRLLPSHPQHHSPEAAAPKASSPAPAPPGLLNFRPPCWILAGRVAMSARSLLPVATHIRRILGD
ncbi:hypothetical protein NDU88_004005 [Pleurodeles waltl]|uniref:Uncharacterized protein n=1 Tax=Pleurodeles waltl TaxID=8319 RepID=A0AAV7LIM7_PLEWA|nr:hypothetical protein NDU88_004005 [Pleurodeles waltl]